MKTDIFLRTEFNYDVAKASLAAGLSCPDATRAQQQFAEEVDINTIVKRFGVTGTVPNSVRAPTYGDFTGVSDYQSALNAIDMAMASFFDMPSDVRKRFDNDPALFVDFCSNPDNLPEMRKLGLAIPELVPEPEPPVPAPAE